MKKLIGAVLIGAMAISLMTGCSPAASDKTGTSETTKEAEARPQDDYYRYINEARLKNVKFKYGAATAGSAFDSTLVNEQVDTVIKDVIAGSGYEAGSEEDIIKKVYDAYLAYDFTKEPIPKDLAAVIDEVKNAKSVDEIMKLDAKLYRDYGIVSMFNLVVGDNFFANESVLSFYQVGAMSGADFKAVREDNTALDSIVTTTRLNLVTLGYDTDTASKIGRELANFVLKIYGATDQEILDGKEQLEYIKFCKRDEIDKLMSNVNLTEYFKTVGYDENYCKNFMVADKTQLERFNSLLTEENLNALKALKINDIYTMYAQVLAPHYKELSGTFEASDDSREKQAIAEIKKTYQSFTDPIYVERYYKKEVDVALRKMCDEIREGYRVLITNAKWLSEPTRKGLLKKLDNIIYLTGTDVKRQDKAKYAGVSGNYYEICTKLLRIGNAEMINSLKASRDRTSVGMAMQEMNACYSPMYNNITITCAITNAPFFDAAADHYTNLGGLGSVIAHEMGHAFDSNDIVYDQDGLYNPKWISDEDRQVLKARDEKAVSYFEDNYIVFGIHHVDGKRTMGENYADLGGMECVTSLAKNKEDLKKIFERYALIWGRKVVDVSLLDQINHDVHSPDIIRVNGILATLECFYDLYDVKEGDKMYIAPEKRISRWY